MTVCSSGTGGIKITLRPRVTLGEVSFLLRSQPPTLKCRSLQPFSPPLLSLVCFSHAFPTHLPSGGILLLLHQQLDPFPPNMLSLQKISLWYFATEQFLRDYSLIYVISAWVLPGSCVLLLILALTLRLLFFTILLQKQLKTLCLRTCNFNRDYFSSNFRD